MRNILLRNDITCDSRPSPIFVLASAHLFANDSAKNLTGGRFFTASPRLLMSLILGLHMIAIRHVGVLHTRQKRQIL